jgi:hypothetical protein
MAAKRGGYTTPTGCLACNAMEAVAAIKAKLHRFGYCS